MCSSKRRWQPQWRRSGESRSRRCVHWGMRHRGESAVLWLGSADATQRRCFWQGRVCAARGTRGRRPRRPNRSWRRPSSSSTAHRSPLRDVRRHLRAHRLHPAGPRRGLVHRDDRPHRGDRGRHLRGQAHQVPVVPAAHPGERGVPARVRAAARLGRELRRAQGVPPRPQARRRRDERGVQGRGAHLRHQVRDEEDPAEELGVADEGGGGGARDPRQAAPPPRRRAPRDLPLADDGVGGAPTRRAQFVGAQFVGAQFHSHAPPTSRRCSSSWWAASSPTT